MEIYLASGSPRRREILTGLGYTVRRAAAEIDETPYPQENAADYVCRMALEKNRAARPQPLALPVLSADTAVVLDGKILGKPQDAEDAFAMLSALSGSLHEVLTAVCVWADGTERLVLQTSQVRFKTLSAAQIRAYIASGEPMDKAGAYGIQGLGGVFVAHLSGSFSGVMGLPVAETAELLAQCGYGVPVLGRVA